MKKLKNSLNKSKNKIDLNSNECNCTSDKDHIQKINGLETGERILIKIDDKKGIK